MFAAVQMHTAHVDMCATVHEFVNKCSVLAKLMCVCLLFSVVCCSAPCLRTCNFLLPTYVFNRQPAFLFDTDALHCVFPVVGMLLLRLVMYDHPSSSPPMYCIDCTVGCRDFKGMRENLKKIIQITFMCTRPVFLFR